MEVSVQEILKSILSLSRYVHLKDCIIFDQNSQFGRPKLGENMNYFSEIDITELNMLKLN